MLSDHSRRNAMKLRLLGTAAFLLCLSVLGFSQEPDLGTQFPGTVRPQRPAPPSRPAPRLPNGRVSLGPIAGEAGLWLPGPGGTPGEPWPPKVNELPFQPWARELYAY